MAFSKKGDPMWDEQYERWTKMAPPNKEYSKNPRPLIQKLGLHITDRMFVKEILPTDPEYYGLDPFVTDEMAEIALKMKVHKYYPLSKLAKMNNRSEESIDKVLREMAQIGLVDFENRWDERWYALPPFIVGSGEYFGMKQSMVDEHVEASYIFDRMAFNPLIGKTQLIPPGGAGMAMHVIPVEKAIDHCSTKYKVEELSYWIAKQNDKFAAMPCVCRMSRETIDEGSGQDPTDMCIACADLADFVVESGRGHYIGYEEVMEILEKAEELGCVHQITNLDGPEKIIGICNCHIDTCCALRASQFFNTPNLSRSAYIAHVEKEKCVACGKCVEVCPAGAVKLGQKLCTTCGEVTYPQAELPDETRWGEDKWNPNYRYDARTNCYDTGTAPCKTACPAHIAIQGYLQFAKEGKYKEALALIKQDNPFPAICGRVCNHRCEDECTRGGIDEAVAIDAVKKFVADLDLDAKTRYVPPIHSMKRYGRFDDVKVGVIGAGPAGLSCAYYLAQMGFYPTVFEKNPLPGGMMRYGIPEYKLERATIDAEIEILKEMGVEIKCGVEIGKDITIQQLRDEGYKSFCLAIGAQKGAKLGIPGEDQKGVFSGIDFLHDYNEGKTPKIGKNVAVIGGGNTAMDVARCAKLMGADVTVVYRRKESDMKADPLEVEEAREAGINFMFEYKPVEITGKTKVTGLKCDKGTVKCDTVIAAIGQKVDFGGIDQEAMVITEKGTVKAAPLTYQTEQKDIFASGDVETGPRFVIDAIAAGREAAISMQRYMRPNTSLELGRNRRDFIEMDKEDISIPANKVNVPKRQTRDTHATLTEEQVKAEASRCLSCGASVVDPHRCIGCGLCTTRCQFDAIHLERDLPEASNLYTREEGKKHMIAYMAKRAAKIAIKELKEKK